MRKLHIVIRQFVTEKICPYNLINMAKLTHDDVLKLAKLARLELTEEEVTSFAEEISSILKFVEQLHEVDVSDLEPTLQVNGLTNVTRSDDVIDYGASSEDLLKNAPAVKDDHIKVRRMII